jgi:hypothetical protein
MEIATSNRNPKSSPHKVLQVFVGTFQAHHLRRRSFSNIQRYTRRDMPSNKATVIMAKNETGATIIGMTVNKAAREIAKTTAVSCLMARLNSSPYDPLPQSTMAKNEAIMELELAVASRERRPLKYQSLTSNLDGKERTRTRAVIETAPRKPALERNPWYRSVSSFIGSCGSLTTGGSISNKL